MNDLERLCIRVPKVYDWITPQTEKKFQFSSGDIDFFTTEDPDHQTAHNLVANVCDFFTDEPTVSCILLEPDDGDGICEEVGGRRDVFVEEFDTELQLVRIKKQGKFQIVLSEVEGDSGKGKGKCKDVGPLFSEPISFFNIERFLLCAPDGTDVICHVYDFDCEGTLVCNGDDAPWTLDLTILICQSIQAEADVKLELEGRICKPRPEIAIPVVDIQCPEFTFPPQCPAVFPQTHHKH